jgi:insertion element IS1 protein InsB
VDAQGSQPVFVTGKRSLDRSGFGREALPARHCSHFQGRAHYHSCFVPKKAAESRLSFPDTLLPAIKGDALEMDELVIRFRFKRHYRYLWIAVSRLTHQVIGFCIADRSYQSLWEFWFSLPADYRRKLVYTDFYQAYAKLFQAWQHRPSNKGSGQTSIVEGLNNKWRNRVAGLVRKTVCVQHLQDLERRLWIVFESHNQLCLKQLEKLILST